MSESSAILSESDAYELMLKIFNESQNGILGGYIIQKYWANVAPGQPRIWVLRWITKHGEITINSYPEYNLEGMIISLYKVGSHVSVCNWKYDSYLKYEIKFNKTKASVSKSNVGFGNRLFEAICEIAQFDPRYIGSHCTAHPDRICLATTKDRVDNISFDRYCCKECDAAYTAQEALNQAAKLVEASNSQSIISFAQPGQFPSAVKHAVPPPIHICCRDEHKNISIYGEAVLEHQGKWYCGLCAVNIE